MAKFKVGDRIVDKKYDVGYVVKAIIEDKWYCLHRADCTGTPGIYSIPEIDENCKLKPKELEVGKKYKSRNVEIKIIARHTPPLSPVIVWYEWWMNGEFKYMTQAQEEYAFNLIDMWKCH